MNFECKIEEWKERKWFFLKLNIKDGNVFYTYISDSNNKIIYMFIGKKKV